MLHREVASHAISILAIVFTLTGLSLPSLAANQDSMKAGTAVTRVAIPLDLSGCRASKLEDVQAKQCTGHCSTCANRPTCPVGSQTLEQDVAQSGEEAEAETSPPPADPAGQGGELQGGCGCTGEQEGQDRPCAQDESAQDCPCAQGEGAQDCPCAQNEGAPDCPHQAQPEGTPRCGCRHGQEGAHQGCPHQPRPTCPHHQNTGE